jgi:hypothetical protein
MEKYSALMWWRESQGLKSRDKDTVCNFESGSVLFRYVVDSGSYYLGTWIQICNLMTHESFFFFLFTAQGLEMFFHNTVTEIWLQYRGIFLKQLK